MDPGAEAADEFFDNIGTPIAPPAKPSADSFANSRREVLTVGLAEHEFNRPKNITAIGALKPAFSLSANAQNSSQHGRYENTNRRREDFCPAIEPAHSRQNHC